MNGEETKGAILGIASSVSSTCLHRENLVECWGANGTGGLGNGTLTQAFAPTTVLGVDGVGILQNVVQISSYSINTQFCALLSDTTVACWGLDAAKPYPVRVKINGTDNLTDVTSVSAGANHACAVTSDRRLWCWGVGTNGQLGNDTLLTSTTAVQVLDITATVPLEDVKQVVAGQMFTCAVIDPDPNISADNEAVCWGSPGNGRLGNNDAATTHKTPVSVRNELNTGNLTNVKSLFANGQGAMNAIMNDGTVFGWGVGWGQFGIGDHNNYALPKQMMEIDTVTPVADATEGWGGTLFSCFKRTNGSIWCVGNYTSHNGAMGNGSLNSSYYPVRVRNIAGTGYLTGATKVALGNSRGCAVIGTTQVNCWGDNTFDNLTMGDFTKRLLPVQIKASATTYLTDVVQVTVGYAVLCALNSSDQLFCWGNNAFGGVGIGYFNFYSLPQLITLDP